MKLIRLHLNHFKGIKEFTLDANGQSINIYGENASGKTTIFDALVWLLVGKDSRDRNPDSFGIKTRGADGKVMHGVDHTVEGVFSVGEKTLTLSKVYKEKWTRKRGAAKEVFTGHTTDHHIDGVPVKASEYQEAVEAIMPERLLKMLTQPDYFPEQMHWTDRRDILFELVGEIEDADIIASATGLERYPEVLGDRTHEQQEKVLKARKREHNKELDNLPSRIDEVSRMIEEVEGVQEAREQVEELKAKKETIEAKRSEVKSGGSVAELKVKLTELDSELIKARNDHQQRIEDSLKDARNKVTELQDKVDEAEAAVRKQTRVYKENEDHVSLMKSKVDTATELVESIQQRKPEPKSAFEPGACPVCERPYEQEEEHDYEQYLSEFNGKKAGDLKEAKAQLSDCQSGLRGAEAELDEAKQKGLKLRAKLNQVEPALNKVKAALAEQKDSQPVFEDSEAYAKLIDQKDAIKARIASHREERQKQLDQLDSHIRGLDSQIEAASRVIHQAEQNAKLQRRIKELQAQRKEVANQLEQTEADLHLLEEFVRARSAYVTDRVNEKFEHVTWKLFEEQINGGVTETCTAVWDGIPYDEGLNNASRIKAGLDIINTLSKHYGKSAPVFVDNRESVSELPENDLQVISLIVSPAHKSLTVEPATERELVNA